MGHTTATSPAVSDLSQDAPPALASALFDDLIALVTQRFRTKKAAICLVGPDRVWLDAANHDGQSLRAADRSNLCARVLAERATLVVAGAGANPEFANHPHVVGPPEIRFYAGVPLIAADGTLLGALCTWDTEPHHPTEDDVRSLEQFGRHAVTMLELHQMAFELDSEREVLAATGYLLEMIVAGAELGDVLEALVRAAEAAILGAVCSINLLDGMVLREGASPGLPEAFRRAIDGSEIGPSAGSCGTAAFTRSTVIVSDVATDPRWAGYRDLALPYGLRACWSVPISRPEGPVLGTFALYYTDAREPLADEMHRLGRWVNLAEVAISRARDITALREAATLDSLTGLVNRTEVLRRIAEAVAVEHNRVGVLFVDLDQFKFINDTLGHAAGDQFLQVVAGRLTRCADESHTVARFGGDEFVVLCPNCDSYDEAKALARKMISALHHPMSIGGSTLSLSASIGIALEREDDPTRSFSDLVGDADLAMYAAKRTGRNSVAVFTPHLRVEASDRLSLEADLNLALSNKELDCEYQPTVAMDTGKVLEVEALLRWRSPTRGAVPPMDFIAVAEESGLIGEIGEFVLRRACAQLATWRAAGGDWLEAVMWVNVSPRQLRDSGFAAVVEEVLKATGVPPERLGLEVTEGTFIDDSDAVRATLLRMRSSGVHVAIDDFGTGYSSLAQLEYLPVDVLKIDRQFVSEIASGSTRSGMISAILTLARTMGLRVVAEGVETEAQRNILLQLGCQYGQGYLWSRPLPASQFSGSLWQFRKVAAI